MLVLLLSSLLFAPIFSEKLGFHDILPDTYPEMVGKYREAFETFKDIAAPIVLSDGTTTHLEDVFDPDLYLYLKGNFRQAPYIWLLQRFRDGAYLKGKDGKVEFKTGLMAPQQSQILQYCGTWGNFFQRHNPQLLATICNGEGDTSGKWRDYLESHHEDEEYRDEISQKPITQSEQVELQKKIDAIVAAKTEKLKGCLELEYAKQGIERQSAEDINILRANTCPPYTRYTAAKVPDDQTPHYGIVSSWNPIQTTTERVASELWTRTLEGLYGFKDAMKQNPSVRKFIKDNFLSIDGFARRFSEADVLAIMLSCDHLYEFIHKWKSSMYRWCDNEHKKDNWTPIPQNYWMYLLDKADYDIPQVFCAPIIAPQTLHERKLRNDRLKAARANIDPNPNTTYVNRSDLIKRFWQRTHQKYSECPLNPGGNLVKVIDGKLVKVDKPLNEATNKPTDIPQSLWEDKEYHEKMAEIQNHRNLFAEGKILNEEQLRTLDQMKTNAEEDAQERNSKKIEDYLATVAQGKAQEADAKPQRQTAKDKQKVGGDGNVEPKDLGQRANVEPADTPGDEITSWTSPVVRIYSPESSWDANKVPVTISLFIGMPLFFLIYLIDSPTFTSAVIWLGEAIQSIPLMSTLAQFDPIYLISKWLF